MEVQGVKMVVGCSIILAAAINMNGAASSMILLEALVSLKLHIRFFAYSSEYVHYVQHYIKWTLFF